MCKIMDKALVDMLDNDDFCNKNRQDNREIRRSRTAKKQFKKAPRVINKESRCKCEMRKRDYYRAISSYADAGIVATYNGKGIKKKGNEGCRSYERGERNYNRSQYSAKNQIREWIGRSKYFDDYDDLGTWEDYVQFCHKHWEPWYPTVEMADGTIIYIKGREWSAEKDEELVSPPLTSSLEDSLIDVWESFKMTEYYAPNVGKMLYILDLLDEIEDTSQIIGGFRMREGSPYNLLAQIAEKANNIK